MAHTKESITNVIRLSPTPLVVALDGDAGSGKSTLASEWGHQFDANVVRIDDFYLPFFKRHDCSSCHIDFDRLLTSVLIPFINHLPLTYDAYDPHQNVITQTFIKEYKPMLILEGSYSYHPILRPYIDLAIGLSIDPPTQKQRIVARSSTEIYERFASIWIPKEKAYQKESNLYDSVDYLLEIQ